ncbi:MAG TPA: biopolymer transporter ExbD [Tepidisphaeraceae bacterium]|nr:biopolymer transporter ExbD [Tepidisphaeraceae bacterium]
MTFDKEPYEPMSVDMTPMVDAIFAIILFLLVASSFVESMESDTSINLPTAGKTLKAKAPPARPIVVNVRNMPGGRADYRVNNASYSMAQMASELSRARVGNKDQAVVIRGDKNVRWDHVAQVMRACAQAGISKVSAAFETDE